MKHFAFCLSLQHITLTDIHTPFPDKNPEFHRNLEKQGSPVFLPDLAIGYKLCNCSTSCSVLKA